MTPHYFILSIFVLGGIVAILASLFNWRWFFEAHNAQAIVSRIGPKSARWFYGITGIAMIALAAYFYSRL